MRTCPDCNASVSDSANFCDNCGFPFKANAAEPPAVMKPASMLEPQGPPVIASAGAGSAPLGTCSACGYLNIPGEMFCDNCGVQLAPVANTPPPPPRPVPGLAYTAAEPPAAGAPAGPAPSSPPAAMPALCPECGYAYLPSDIFCPNCGLKLPKDESAVLPAAPPAAGGQPPAAAESPLQPHSAAPPAIVAPPASAVPPLPPLPIGSSFPSAVPPEPSPAVGASPLPVGPPAPPPVVGAPFPAAVPPAPPAGVDPDFTGAPSRSEPFFTPAAKFSGRLFLRETGEELAIPPGRTDWIIGRSDTLRSIFPDIDLTAYGGDTRGVSRRHARLSWVNDRLHIEDLNSTNFTFINQQRIQPGQPHPVKDGDEVRLGLLALVFRQSSS